MSGTKCTLADIVALEHGAPTTLYSIFPARNHWKYSSTDLPSLSRIPAAYQNQQHWCRRPTSDCHYPPATNSYSTPIGASTKPHLASVSLTCPLSDPRLRERKPHLLRRPSCCHLQESTVRMQPHRSVCCWLEREGREARQDCCP